MSKNSKSQDPQHHFQAFAKQLEKEISKVPGFPAKKTKLAEIQRVQLERLFELEEHLKLTLLEHPEGEAAINDFFDYILIERRNILDARPYFRERQTDFTDFLSPALKNRDAGALIAHIHHERIKKCKCDLSEAPKDYDGCKCPDILTGRHWIVSHRFNYRFYHYINSKRDLGPEFRDLFRAQEEIRAELCVTNTPLAISRAKIFYSKTTRSHLSYMDMIQISSEGLISAIDKMVPFGDRPLGRLLCSVAVGRSVGNLIQNYSETMLHFYPKDRRLLYRKNKADAKGPDISQEELTDKVNDGLIGNSRTTVTELGQLQTAASMLSIDMSIDDENKTTVSDSVASPETAQPDRIAEGRSVQAALRNAIGKLTPFKRKLVLLRGIEL